MSKSLDNPTDDVSPVLSICIPTFNRAAFIGATLATLIPQLTQQIEIVIVDGGSTDNTPDVVRPYTERDPRIRYQRQHTNAGVDRDMDRSVRLARGQYCWLVSSDDYALPGAIERIVIECAPLPDFVIVNGEIRDFGMNKLLRDRILLIERDETYRADDRERFFLTVGRYLSFMGGVVIRRDLWLQRVHEELYGTEFIHLGVILERGIERFATVIATPLVAVRYGNFTWARRMFEISMFKWPAMIWSLPGYSDEAKTRVCPQGGWRDLLRLLYHRSLGGLSPQDAEAYIARKQVRWPLRAAVSAIARLPNRVLNAAAILYYSQRPGGGDTVYLLRTCAAYWRGTR
jgi:glycosyltransferase involved in cell wall biosynthesis